MKKNKNTYSHIHTKQSHLTFTITNFKWRLSSTWQSYDFCLIHSFSHFPIGPFHVISSLLKPSTPPLHLHSWLLPFLPFSQWNRKHSLPLPAWVPVCHVFPVIYCGWTNRSCLRPIPPLGYQIPVPSISPSPPLHQHCFLLYGPSPSALYKHILNSPTLFFFFYWGIIDT